MKLSFEIDDCELQSQIFIQLLKQQLRDSKDYIKTFKHPDDVKSNKKIIKACNVLLDYYIGEWNEDRT